MTRDEIIKLASQAIDDTRSEVDLPVPFVLRFANLVIADFLAQTGQYVTNDASREAAIKKAVNAEREACAKVCGERAEAWQAAHLAGQRAMQERAARGCDGSMLTIVDSDWSKGYDQAIKDVSEGIRSLEVKP